MLSALLLARSIRYRPDLLRVGCAFGNMEPTDHLPDALPEAILAYGFEQIVYGIHVKSLLSVLFVGGGENHNRWLGQPAVQLCGPHSVHPRHPDIQEDNVVLGHTQKLLSFHRVGSLTHNLYTFHLFQERAQMSAGRGFIIHYERAYASQTSLPARRCSPMSAEVPGEPTAPSDRATGTRTSTLVPPSGGFATTKPYLCPNKPGRRRWTFCMPMPSESPRNKSEGSMPGPSSWIAITLSLIHISEPTRLRRISYAV